MKIKIGVPSKGRLRKDVLQIFKKNKYTLISARGKRDYFAKIKNKSNIEIIYLHAREIIERLSDNSLDIGFSGYDLLKETPINIQKKISVFTKYNFGNAKLVVASEIITDITSTGETLKANNLRVLKDGIILESQACLLISKKSKKKTALSGLLNSFS